MALQTVTLDPNAVAYTDNEIIDKINAGSNSISRVDSLDYDALNIVKTGPQSGDHKVKSVNHKSTGEIEIQYDDVPVP